MIVLLLISAFLPGSTDVHDAKAAIHSDSLNAENWSDFSSVLMLQGDPLYDWAMARSEYLESSNSFSSLNHARELCLQGDVPEAINCLKEDGSSPGAFTMQAAILQDNQMLNESQAMIDSCYFESSLVSLLQARQTRLTTGLIESRSYLQQIDSADLSSDEFQIYLLELGYQGKYRIDSHKALYTSVSSYFTLFGLSNCETVSQICTDDLKSYMSAYYAYIRNSHRPDSYVSDAAADVNSIFFQSLLSFHQERYTEAMELIETIPDSSVSGHRINLLKGLIYLRIYRYSEAYSLMDQCLASGKPSSELFFIQGLAAEFSNDLAKATELYLSAGSGLSDAMALDHLRHMAAPEAEDYNFGMDVETRLESYSVSRFSGRSLFSYNRRTGEMKTMDLLISSYLSYSFGYNGSYAGASYSYSFTEYPEMSQKLKTQIATFSLSNYFDDNHYYTLSSEYDNYSFTTSRYDLDISGGLGYDWDVSPFSSLKPSVKLGWALYSEEDTVTRLLLGTAAVRASFYGTRYSSYIPDLVLNLGVSQGLSSTDIFEYEGSISAEYHINRYFSLSSEYHAWKNADLSSESELQTKLSSILTVRY